MKIAAGHTIILRLPSGAFKLVTINPLSSSCSLGKFGTFDVNDLINHEYGYTYEISPDKKLKIVSASTLLKLENEVANNQLIDDESANQTLTQEEIIAMRTGDRDDLIEKLKANNKSFELKNQFSKEKYTARKMAKFSSRFTTIPPNTIDVLKFLLDKDADKLLFLSEESLGYLLNIADVRPGFNYLVVDEVCGLLVAAVLERGGNVTLVHETEHCNVDSLKYFPHLDPSELVASGRLQAINWEQVIDPVGVMSELERYIEKKASSTHPRDIEKCNRRREMKEVLERFAQVKFDGVVTISNYTPQSFLPHLLPHVALSRKVAIYHPYREPLLTLRHVEFKDLLAPAIFEIGAREIQVLEGRTRPVMMKPGEWGYIYHAIKVARVEGVNATGKSAQGRGGRPGRSKKLVEGTDEKGSASALDEASTIVERTAKPDETLKRLADIGNASTPQPLRKRVKLDDHAGGAIMDTLQEL